MTLTSAHPDALSWRPAPGRLPEGLRVYTVGDIHGRADLVRRLLADIQTDAENADGRVELVFLGDYVDRGPASAEVVDILLDDLPPTLDVVTLMGNHELMMLNFLDDPANAPTWLANGGVETCESYGVFGSSPFGDIDYEALRQELLDAVPERHVEFLEGLVVDHRRGDYIFVHAGVDPRKPLDDQTIMEKLWIRDRFLKSDEDFGGVVVHGHSITETAEIKANRIGLDTGAYAGGPLSCAVLESDRMRIMEARGPL